METEAGQGKAALLPGFIPLGFLLPGRLTESPSHEVPPEVLIAAQPLVWLPALLPANQSSLTGNSIPLLSGCDLALKLFASSPKNLSSSSKLSALVVSIP